MRRTQDVSGACGSSRNETGMLMMVALDRLAAAAFARRGKSTYRSYPR